MASWGGARGRSRNRHDEANHAIGKLRNPPIAVPPFVNSHFKDVNELAEWLSWTERSERLRKSCVRIGQKKSAEIDEDSLG